MIFKTYNKIVFLFFLLGLIFQNAYSQKDTITYEVDVHAVLSTGEHSPFWLQNNRFGDVSHNANSAALEMKMSKTMQHPERLLDYSFSLTGHVHEHEHKTELELNEMYVNTRLWIFNLCAGKRLQSYGNQDETLSGGGLLFSNNSKPIPKIFAGIEEFTPLFFKNNFFEIKGGMSHGWFADDVFVSNMLFHHKYAAVRFGGRKSPIRFQYGLDHAAQWGGNVPGYGVQSTTFHDFVHVFLAHGGSSVSNVSSEQINVAGNHLISQSTKIEYRLNDYELAAYWQNINEDKPLRPIWNAVNIADGLWGFSIKNKEFPILKGLLYEYLNTTDQNGPLHDKDGIVFGGADSYFNNYMYQSGWTHYRRTIGTPFLTSPVYNTDGSVVVQNNRVQVHHFGLEGSVKGYDFRVLNSYSKNYGAYHLPYNVPKNAVNLLVELNKQFEKLWGIEAGLSVGADWGAMYGSNYGLLFRIGKSGDLFRY